MLVESHIMEPLLALIDSPGLPRIVNTSAIWLFSNICRYNIFTTSDEKDRLVKLLCSLIATTQYDNELEALENICWAMNKFGECVPLEAAQHLARVARVPSRNVKTACFGTLFKMSRSMLCAN